MPVDFQFTPGRLTQDEMRELDCLIMPHANASQKELGRLCNEKIYQFDLAERLSASGLSVSREVPLKVSHKEFSMTYFLDLVVEGKAIYELKACTSLSSAHTAQLLNYLFLCSSTRGQLINFRPGTIESRYVNSPISDHQRKAFDVVTKNWKGEDTFLHTVIELVQDWGAGLELALYRNALIHLFGGELHVTKPISLTRGGVILGQQSFNIYSPNTAFAITSFTKGLGQYASHLHKMLIMAKLDRFYWANIVMGKIEFQTITL